MDFGGFGDVLSSISDSFSSLTGIFAGAGGNQATPEKFKIVGQDWYKVFGYQFVISHSEEPEVEQTQGGFLDGISNAFNQLTSLFDGGAADSDPLTKYYTLPIPPQSIVIKPIIASQATPTLGGVVEETSENVLWMISMQGTTGIAVSRDLNGQSVDRKTVAKQFRDTISTTGLLAGVAGQLNQTIAQIGGVADAAIDSFQSFASGDIAGGIGNAVNAANTAVLPPLPYAGSAVSEKSNGFTEIQELVKFFDKYNELKHANPKQYSLLFRMYKTNQEWNCIVQDFSIQKSAQSPHLWRYNLVLKCWALRVVGANLPGSGEFDRFGSNGDLKSVNTVGLGALDMLSQVNSQGGFGIQF